MPQTRAMEMSDEELACRARQGCVPSFEELVRRFQAPMLQFLYHQGAGADAEDVLQETFVRAFRKLHHYLPQRRFAPWLFTIGRRVCINHHRRRRASCGEDLRRFPSGAAEPGQALADEEDRRLFWDAVARILSEEERTALWLFYVEEMPAREIAAVLGRSRAGVKTMMYRARRRLLARRKEFLAADAGGRARSGKNQALTADLPGLEIGHA
jgi:RNA polymerase sigma-70 factor (ECF subfamily)